MRVPGSDSQPALGQLTEGTPGGFAGLAQQPQGVRGLSPQHTPGPAETQQGPLALGGCTGETPSLRARPWGWSVRTVTVGTFPAASNPAPAATSSLSQQQARPLPTCPEPTSCGFCNWAAPQGDSRPEPGEGDKHSGPACVAQQLRAAQLPPAPACSSASRPPLLSPQMQASALWQTLQGSWHQPGSSSELPSPGDPLPSAVPQPERQQLVPPEYSGFFSAALRLSPEQLPPLTALGRSRAVPSLPRPRWPTASLGCCPSSEPPSPAAPGGGDSPD